VTLPNSLRFTLNGTCFNHFRSAAYNKTFSSLFFFPLELLPSQFLPPEFLPSHHLISPELIHHYLLSKVHHLSSQSNLTVIMLSNAMESLTIASSKPKFSDLPFEIRKMIWLYCIPSRVIELEVPPDRRLPSHSATCISWTTHQNTRTPVVTRICRESRQVVLKECGGPIDHKEARPSTEYKVTKMPWFYPGRDIISWSSLSCTLPYGPKALGDHSYFIKYSLQARDVVVPGELIFPFRYLMPPKEMFNFKPNFNRTESDGFRVLNDFMVCLQIVTLHMSPEEALNSTISGRTGDSLVHLVDIYDAVQIKKISDEVKPQDANTELIFDRLLQTETLHHEVDVWKEHAKLNWICRSFENYHADRSDEQFEHDRRMKLPSRELECFVKHPQDTSPGEVDHERWFKSYINHNPPRFDRFMFDMSIPWVQWAYNDVPTFRPVIMFRLCVRNCAQLRSTSFRQEMYSGRYPPEYQNGPMRYQYEAMWKLEEPEEEAMAAESRKTLKRL